MNVLLSVKPKYAEEIISGRKKYEFRKSIFKREDIKKMYIYSSSPVKKIIALVDIDCILSDSPQELWEQCHGNAGISDHEFFKYFKNSDIGYAIKFSNVLEFSTPVDPYNLNENFRPPQSFYYPSLSFLQTFWNSQNTNMDKGNCILGEPSSGYSSQK